MADQRDVPERARLTIKRAELRDYDAIVALFREAKWRAPANAGEFWIARRAIDSVAAAQILDAPAGYAYLGAIVVTRDARRSGVGTRLLETLIAVRDTDWWLECREELVPFYLPHGFAIADDREVPDWARAQVGTRPRTITFMRRLRACGGGIRERQDVV